MAHSGKIKLAVSFVLGLELWVGDGLCLWLLQRAVSHTLRIALCATFLSAEKD